LLLVVVKMLLIVEEGVIEWIPSTTKGKMKLL
jgi:hypothetical protein